jgi:hypothetical protein
MTLEPGSARTRLIGMMVSRRLTMVLAATAVPVLLTVGCASATSTHPAAAGTAGASPTSSSHAAPTSSFSAMGLSFRYPAAWRSVIPRAGLSDFPAPIVYLSTSRLSGTCVVSASPGRTAATCAYPIRVLPPGGVLVRWNANGLPKGQMPKATTTVAGRGAVESKTRGGWCAVMGGTETITVMIPRAVPGKWYQMDACVRGPGLPQQEAQISSMLRSVRISPGT